MAESYQLGKIEPLSEIQYTETETKTKTISKGYAMKPVDLDSGFEGKKKKGVNSAKTPDSDMELFAMFKKFMATQASGNTEDDLEEDDLEEDESDAMSVDLSAGLKEGKDESKEPKTRQVRLQKDLADMLAAIGRYYSAEKGGRNWSSARFLDQYVRPVIEKAYEPFRERDEKYKKALKESRG